MSTTLDNRKELLESELNFQLLKNYGNRLGISSIEEISKNKYRIKVEYNKVFNIIDESTRTIFVRNIHFDNIYSTELKEGDKLKLPVRELNRSINDEFLELREQLFGKVIQNREIVMKILQNVHTASAFLNKFNTILQEIFYQDGLNTTRYNFFKEKENGYSQYLELILDTGLAKKEGDRLKPTAQFYKLFEGEDVRTGLEKTLSVIVQKHYDFIVYELSIRQIKAYISIVSSYFFLSQEKDVGQDIEINQLYKVHRSIFGKAQFPLFLDRVYALVTSGILRLENNRVALAI